jgi:hypothetical protein
MTRFHVVIALAAAALISGCIVQDEVTTISVRPDGSASLIVFHSNVRSTEEGSKAAEELRQYVETFDARSSDDFVRIRQAGGEAIDGQWLQREVPYSNLISAKLPNAAALEKFCSIEGKDDELRLTTRFSADGTRRKLTMVALPPRDFKLPDNSARSLADLEQDKANGFSETRLVVVGGEIVASKGWTVASDKHSALLSLDEIARLLRNSPNRIELFIEWQVPGK